MHIGISPPTSALAFAAALLIAAAAPAQQQSRLQQLVDASIAELDVADKRADALRKLQNLGPRLAPELKARLSWRRRGELGPQAARDLLWLAGEQGRAALPMIDELREYLRDSDSGLALDAARAMTRIAPFLSHEVADAVLDDLNRAGAAVRSDGVVGALPSQLRLAVDPEPGQVIYWLEHGDTAGVASCRWVIAHADEIRRDDNQHWQKLALQLTAGLDEMLVRRAVCFDRGCSTDAAEYAEALLALTDAPLTASVARGLLVHRAPHQRLRGVAWLAEHGRELPLPERADLAVRLWDGDAEVVGAAAAALARLGREGAVGLAPLHHFAAKHPAETVRQACGTAASAIAAAFADLDPADAAAVAAIDRALRGEPGGAALTALGAPVQQFAAAVLHLAQWHDPAALLQVLDLLDGAHPDDAVVGNVYSWLTSKRPELSRIALAWLARRGPATRRAIAARCTYTVDAFAELTRLCRAWVHSDARPDAIEACSWMLGYDADVDTLLEMLQCSNTRWNARALSELLRRQLVRLPEPRLRELLSLPDATPLRLEIPAENWSNDPGRPYLLAEPLRVLAAIALADHRGELPDEPTLAAAVQRHLGVTLPALADHVARLRNEGTLAATLDALETDCRRRLGVDEALRWPRLDVR